MSKSKLEQFNDQYNNLKGCLEYELVHNTSDLDVPNLEAAISALYLSHFLLTKSVRNIESV